LCQALQPKQLFKLATNSLTLSALKITLETQFSPSSTSPPDLPVTSIPEPFQVPSLYQEFTPLELNLPINQETLLKVSLL
jgi:hypothetical protein